MIPTTMLSTINAVLLFSWCSLMLGGTVVVLDCSDCEYFYALQSTVLNLLVLHCNHRSSFVGNYELLHSLLLVDGNLSSDETVLLGSLNSFGLFWWHWFYINIVIQTKILGVGCYDNLVIIILHDANS